jgi:hypothetical protein
MNGTICLLFLLEWRERYFLWKSAHVSDFLLRSPPFRKSTMIVVHFERGSDMRDCCEVISYQSSTFGPTVKNGKEDLACFDVKLSSASPKINLPFPELELPTDKNILRTSLMLRHVAQKSAPADSI